MEIGTFLEDNLNLICRFCCVRAWFWFACVCGLLYVSIFLDWVVKICLVNALKL